jgi:hypothetical protein
MERVELLEGNAAKLVAQLAAEEDARARLELQLAEAHKVCARVCARARRCKLEHSLLRRRMRARLDFSLQRHI